jgi:hypothetical protein
LHNNSLGDYNGDPSVEGRIRAFDDAIDKMFWKEKRRGIAAIARTGAKCSFIIPAAYLPGAVEGAIGPAAHPFTTMPWFLPALTFLLGLVVVGVGRRRRGRMGRYILVLVGALVTLTAVILIPANAFIAGKLGDLRIGPFPRGMPVNLLASMNPQAPTHDLLSAFWKMHKACRRIEKENLSDEEGTRVFEAEAAPALLKVSKSPDWVEDRGHYFAAPLSDEDKRALKEYLKTF